jgi:phenylacetate-CoA ligase
MAASLVSDAALARLWPRLRDLAARSAHYRDRIPVDVVDGPPSVDALRRIAGIHKEEIIALQRARPPFGDVLVGERPRDGRCYVSPGPVYLVLSAADVEASGRSLARQWEICGIGAGDVVDVSSSFHWVFAGLNCADALAEIGAVLVPGGPGFTDVRVQTMRELGVTVLQAFTPYAEEIGVRLREQGVDPARDLGVRLLVIGGELRTERSKARLAELWGNPAIVEVYGTAETGITAVECSEAADGMHLADDVIVEVVDVETGDAVGPGEPGEIVITELLREAMPVLRLFTGDITEGYTLDRCACGRDVPRLGRILGRKSTIPRVRGLFLSPVQVREVLDRHAGLGPCRIVISRPGRTDDLRIEIEAEPGVADSAAVGDALRGTIRLAAQIELVAPGSLGIDRDVVDDQRVVNG